MSHNPANFSFESLMTSYYPNHSWEPLAVYAKPDPTFTENDDSDRYELTTYKIWNEKKCDDSKGWVFF